MKRRTLRVRIEPTTLTHLVCIRCGGFRTELAIVTPSDHDDREPQAGVHKACAKAIHFKRGAA